MPGAETPFATSFFSACAIGSSFLPQPAISVAAAPKTTAHFMHVENPGFIFALTPLLIAISVLRVAPISWLNHRRTPQLCCHNHTGAEVRKLAQGAVPLHQRADIKPSVR